MTRVLIVGYAPDGVDLGDPLVPEGMTVEKVAKGLEQDARKMAERGWDAEHLEIRPGDDVRAMILGRLRSGPRDCVVVGGGVRVTARHVDVLETVVAAIREGAPDTPIAFNEGPDKSDEAVARVLGLPRAHA